MTNYKTKDGKILVVKHGIGSGESYMTMYPKPNGIAWKRFVRPELPVRNTRADAQADLDAYARTHLFEPIEVEDIIFR